ncbi:MAG: PAS domain S-box protein, partial [Deltaproteobacteria bacterium]|nr:PAS domain S-box protein [Deltaproteobacteria bacterium]
MEKPLEILIIEDSQDDADLVVREMRHGGIDFRYQRVDTASQMNAALDNQTWNLILSDYDLPKFSGPAALQIVKERSLDLPFIVVSGKIGEEKAVSFMKAGAHDYIMKGNLSRLVPAVQRELREAEERRKRQWAEAELKETKNHLEKVLEKTADAIGIVNQRGYFTKWNKMAAQLYGYSYEEMSGIHFTRLYPGKKAMEIMLGQLRRDGFICRYEIDMQKKDGSIAPFEISISLLRDADSKVVGSICVARDLSELKKTLAEVTRMNEQLSQEIEERHRAEKALENERRRFFAILDELPGMVYLQAPDYSIIFANRYFKEKIGNPEGKKCYHIFHDRHKPCEICAVREVFATNAPVLREVKGPNGRFYQLHDYPFTDIDGSPLMLQLGIDITERKQAEEALREIQGQQKAILDNIPDIAWLKDKEGRYIAANKPFAQSCGVRQEDLEG